MTCDKNIASLPPILCQRFSATLLSYPAKLNDDETDLGRMYQYYCTKLKKKLEKCPSQKKKCTEFEAKFLEIYERIKTTKENGEAKKRNKTEEPFYNFVPATRNGWPIYKRLRYGKMGNAADGSNSKISEI